MKSACCLAIGLLLVGCGQNSSSMKNVSGVYDFNTEEFVGICSDNSLPDSEKQSFKNKVTQEGDILKIEKLDDKAITGLIITKEVDSTENLDEEGNFVVTKLIEGNLEGVPGQVRLEYVTQGQFLDTGWKGEYEVTVSFLYTDLICKSHAPFTGSKISTF